MKKKKRKAPLWLHPDIRAMIALAYLEGVKVGASLVYGQVNTLVRGAGAGVSGAKSAKRLRGSRSHRVKRTRTRRTR